MSKLGGLRADERRVEIVKRQSTGFQERFFGLRNRWRDQAASLREQHEDLLKAAIPLLDVEIPHE